MVHKRKEHYMLLLTIVMLSTIVMLYDLDHISRKDQTQKHSDKGVDSHLHHTPISIVELIWNDNCYSLASSSYVFYMHIV